MYEYIRKHWLGISLKKKLGIYVCLVILVILVSVLFSFLLMDFALGNFNTILDDNSRCYNFQEAMEQEASAFQAYTRNRTRDYAERYEESCRKAEQSLRELPFDYQTIGAARYGRTWNIRNAYENYCISRDELLEKSSEDERYIQKLYQVYSMQEYLQIYARQLLQLTMAAGDGNYQRQVPFFYGMPYWILALSVVMIGTMCFLTRLLSHAVVDPMEMLADATRKIAVNDFSGQDLTVENQDEMGEMVQAFNKMKHATKGYIQTLMTNHEISELLHKEAMERMEAEKQLEEARLDLLKSQINPHFLFNTLNIIACMAKLEDAYTTEKMITSMSNLFRYNLKTTEQTVPLNQELKVVQDYTYIQKMRFGSRIRYDCCIKVDGSAVRIPAFTLQPLVENAIVHGIAKKEQGGRVFLKVWKKGEMLVISVADTGMGMEEELKRQVLEALKNRNTSMVGIGLGNIYQRIHTMYPGGWMKIYGKKERGTVIQIGIPGGEAEEG